MKKIIQKTLLLVLTFEIVYSFFIPIHAFADDIINISQFSQNCNTKTTKTYLSNFQKDQDYSITVFIGNKYHNNYLVHQRTDFQLTLPLVEEKPYYLYIGSDTGDEGVYTQYTDQCKKNNVSNAQSLDSGSHKTKEEDKKKISHSNSIAHEDNQKQKNMRAIQLPDLKKTQHEADKNLVECNNVKMIVTSEAKTNNKIIFHLSSIAPNVDKSLKQCNNLNILSIALFKVKDQEHIVESLYDLPLKVDFVEKNIEISVKDKCQKEIRLYVNRSKEIKSFNNQDENQSTLINNRWPDQQSTYLYKECFKEEKKKNNFIFLNTFTAITTLLMIIGFFKLIASILITKYNSEDVDDINNKEE